MGKILILYATAGIGHKKAALAVKDAFERRSAKDVLLADALDYTSAFFKASYGAIYLFLIRYLPTIWGFFYYVLDNPFVYAFVAPLRRLTNFLNSRKLVKFLLETNPETVIVTHFMPSEVITSLKRKGLLPSTRLISVITDYRLHLFWFSRYVDYYIAASDYTKADFIRRGISPERIKVFGIPCAASFSAGRDRKALKKKIGLDPEKNAIFLLGGGFGVGPIEKIVLYLDRSEKDFQCITVCGYNEKLKKAIENIAKTSRHKMAVYGFTDNVDELMAISDLLVSKSGGITVTESLNADLPMIVIHPIPGQEKRNYGFLEANDAAVKIGTPREVVGVMKELISSGKLKTLRENVKKIRLTGSADKIVDLVYERGDK